MAAVSAAISLNGFFIVKDGDGIEDVAPKGRRHRPLPMERALANVVHRNTFAALEATEAEQSPSERAGIVDRNDVAPNVSRVRGQLVFVMHGNGQLRFSRTKRTRRSLVQRWERTNTPCT